MPERRVGGLARTLRRLDTWAVACLFAPVSLAQPAYTIVDMGLVGSDTNAQGNAISPQGAATGRSLPASGSAHAFRWTQAGGLVALANFPSRAYAVGHGASDSGVVVGTGTTTVFGSSPLPLWWQGGTVAQLPLPAGQAFGRAYGMNNQGTAVGSVGSGSGEFGVIYTGGPSGSASIITKTTPSGQFVRTAFGINDAGRVVGFGIDPANAAVNVGYVLDTSTNTAFNVGALPGRNGAICFGVSNGGHVVGSTMLNQGPGLPFIWHDSTGMVAIPLPNGTSEGSARAVNASGKAVGTAASAFAIPFLYDGVATYRLADLLPPGSLWDLSTNTSSSAMGISDDGVIVGSGVLGGAVHAYAMIPVVSCYADCDEDGVLSIDDFICFQTFFALGDLYADCDEDGALSIDDFICFQTFFAIGC